MYIFPSIFQYLCIYKVNLCYINLSKIDHFLSDVEPFEKIKFQQHFKRMKMLCDNAQNLWKENWMSSNIKCISKKWLFKKYQINGKRIAYKSTMQIGKSVLNFYNKQNKGHLQRSQQ